MTTLYCALCDGRFEPDTNHIWISAEHKRINDRNETNEFAVHPDCWRQLTADWTGPV